MMVVVAIIGLLIAALLPAIGAARTSARNAQAGAQFQAIGTGLELFKGESALGGAYPPSASDRPGTSGEFQMIKREKPPKDVRVSGAQLLVHAMIGADRLGTAGFRDLRNGGWWDDMHNDDSPEKEGLYAIKAGQAVFTRYGGAGFVDDKMKARAASLAQLVDKGLVVNTAYVDTESIGKNEAVFLDPWDHPILYYRGAAHNIRMTTGKTAGSGIYRQEDNGIITGTDSDGIKALDGLDFGQGREAGLYHYLAKAKSPDTTEKVDTILNDAAWDKTFARFIIDASSKARPEPVRKDSYLLISAGPDSRYGTEDDVVNWAKGQK